MEKVGPILGFDEVVGWTEVDGPNVGGKEGILLGTSVGWDDAVGPAELVG